MGSTIQTATDLGKIVQAARKAQQLSQDDLAGLSGTGRRFKGCAYCDARLQPLATVSLNPAHYCLKS